MERIAVKRNITGPIRPSDCFEVIIGTGTGGISALLLGRMRLTVDQAIEEYVRMAETAFKPSLAGLVMRFRQPNILLDGNVLERVVGDIVQKFLGDREAPVKSTSNDRSSCRTVVLAANSANADAPPYLFRSYDASGPASTFFIREVARASAATAGIFPPAVLGYSAQLFISAAIAGYNSPAELGLAEAAEL